MWHHSLDAIRHSIRQNRAYSATLLHTTNTRSTKSRTSLFSSRNNSLILYEWTPLSMCLISLILTECSSSIIPLSHHSDFHILLFNSITWWLLPIVTYRCTCSHLHELGYIADMIRILEADGVMPIPVFISGVEGHTVVRGTSVCW